MDANPTSLWHKETTCLSRCRGLQIGPILTTMTDVIDHQKSQGYTWYSLSTLNLTHLKALQYDLQVIDFHINVVACGLGEAA